MGLFARLFGRKDENKTNTTPQIREEDLHEEKTQKADWESVSGVPQELAASEVQELYESEAPPVLLDVREEAERQQDGWIPNSVHIPMDEVESRLEELEPGRPVVVYCASGMRSMDVGVMLLEKGFQDVSNLNGGLSAWSGPRETPNN